jgi:hypothetical protein
MADKPTSLFSRCFQWLLHDPQARVTLCSWLVIAGVCVVLANTFAAGF